MPREPENLPPNPLLGFFGLTEAEAKMTAAELAEWEACLDAEARRQEWNVDGATN